MKFYNFSIQLKCIRLCVCVSCIFSCKWAWTFTLNKSMLCDHSNGNMNNNTNNIASEIMVTKIYRIPIIAHLHATSHKRNCILEIPQIAGKENSGIHPPSKWMSNRYGDLIVAVQRYAHRLFSSFLSSFLFWMNGSCNMLECLYT